METYLHNRICTSRIIFPSWAPGLRCCCWAELWVEVTSRRCVLYCAADNACAWLAILSGGCYQFCAPHPVPATAHPPTSPARGGGRGQHHTPSPPPHTLQHCQRGEGGGVSTTHPSPPPHTLQHRWSGRWGLWQLAGLNLRKFFSAHCCLCLVHNLSGICDYQHRRNKH